MFLLSVWFSGVSSHFFKLSGIYLPLPGSPSCPGGVSTATEGGLSPGGGRKTNNHCVLTCTCSVRLKRSKHLKRAFFLLISLSLLILIILIMIINNEMTPGELACNRPVNRGQFYVHRVRPLYSSDELFPPSSVSSRPLQLFPGQSPSQTITGSSFPLSSCRIWMLLYP